MESSPSIIKKILMVDDDSELLQSYADILNDEGFEVVMAFGGEEAVEYAKDQEFHLIVSDVRMPQGNGMQLLDQIRNKLNLKTPFIFISGYDDELTTRSKNLETQLFLAKPLCIPQLINYIKKLT
jgi:DNA-binding response OmpR family regulator